MALVGVRRTLLKRKRVVVAAPTYTGPGDIVSSWIAWYGLRSYNAAYATGSNPAVDLVDQAGGNSVTINIKTDGSLDVAAISTWVAAHSVTTILVAKWYDQSGNSRHVAQATLARMPALELSVIGSLPGMHFLGSGSVTNHLKYTAVAITQAQPFYMSAAYRRDSANNGAFNGLLVNGANSTGFMIDSVASKVSLFAGSSFADVTAADGSFHAVQGLFNSSSSSIYLDGSLTGSLNPGTGDFGAASEIWIGDDPNLNRGVNGYILETGLIGGDKTANNSALNSNQHTYWGF